MPEAIPLATVARLGKPEISSSPLQAPPVSPKVIHEMISDIALEGVAFDSRSHRLVVVDQEAGPGSRFADAADAGRSRDALAAANAGFFTSAGEPLGLVVSDGDPSGAWNGATSLGSGIWFEAPGGIPGIARRENLGRSAALTMGELIQAGPLLIENGRPVSGLETTKSRVRTLLLWDGRTRWWLGRTSPCTLAELAAALAHGQPAGWPVRHALNLDGGRSADLWISKAVTGGPLTRRALWNRPVRNFLVLKTR